MAYYGSYIDGIWRAYLNVTSVTYPTPEVQRINFTYGVDLKKALSGNTFEYKYNSANRSIPTSGSCKAKGWHQLGSGYVQYTRTHSNYGVSFNFWLKHSGSGASWKGTSTATASATITARPSYKVAYNLNSPNGTEAYMSGTGSGYDSDGEAVFALATMTNRVPPHQVKWYGEPLTLSGDIPELDDPRYLFATWYEENTAPEPIPDDDPKAHAPASVIGKDDNRAFSLYAIWEAEFPPYCKPTDLTVTTHMDGDDAIVGFSGASVKCTNIVAFNDGEHEKEMGDDSTISLMFGDTIVKTKTGGFVWAHDDDYGNNYYEDVTINASAVDLDGIEAGTYPVYIVITDSLEKSNKIYVGDITFVDPTWSKTVEIHGLPPRISNGYAVLDSVQIRDFTALPTDKYDDVSGAFQITVVNDGAEDPSDALWTFEYTFDKYHVDDPTELEPNIDIKVEFKHFDTHEKPYREAFFNTTRNQNYSNGIYNVMFIGGVEDNPNYTSRVWWSQINNPLYFPDMNYIEVGSNDTMVMGLTKVGDYLAVIKQSKTTDTAIFLAYPTSFEEETTFAVRQGVQGVGSLARYSFNILGDETLFLSPKGVMAIVPSQDEEHKVQNRSYFIDGRLLKEPNIDEAYSFVFDGMYYLAVNGVVYALDGNQRNSWGNDKTNLVYECYYLDNIPARCFVKFQDSLVFSTYDEVCIVSDTYQDAYGYDENGELILNAPVKAEWSTILDDDGSLHYYKTMQKKGNLVSVLPEENEQPYIQVFVDEETFNENKTLYFTLEDGKYVRCTEDDEFVFVYATEEISEEDFNANKTMYYVLSGDQYVQCTEASVYDSTETYYFKQGVYYVENRTNTKVFVKKDDKDEVEIERSFSLSSDIPSEMFLRKKFKKYKRLQFIIRNEAPEAFGVDSIIKNYTVQNYAKK